MVNAIVCAAYGKSVLAGGAGAIANAHGSIHKLASWLAGRSLLKALTAPRRALAPPSAAPTDLELGAKGYKTNRQTSARVHFCLEVKNRSRGEQVRGSRLLFNAQWTDTREWEHLNENESDSELHAS